jgi:hypothetical protein
MRRTKAILVRVTLAEKEALEVFASRARRSVSDYLRFCALVHFVPGEVPLPLQAPAPKKAKKRHVGGKAA